MIFGVFSTIVWCVFLKSLVLLRGISREFWCNIELLFFFLGFLVGFVLSCALGQVWWTDNHSCSNCDLFAYMSWMQRKLHVHVSR